MTVERIFLIFLEKQSDQSSEYKEAVKSLAQSIDKDGSLETDGISTFRTCLVTDSGPDPGLDEDLCRRIGAQLAALGDRFESENLIKPQLVEGLVNEILDNSLTEARFGAAVKALLSNVPPGIEQEKASLVVAMLLTRKIGNSIPSLLQTCFATTVNFIQGNYNAYIEGLVQQR